MAVAVTSCTTDTSRDRGRRWFKHQWECTTCHEEVRFYSGVGWHHYIQRFPSMSAPAPEVTVEIIDMPGTSMPPRRALMELEAELARAYRPRLYLVPPMADPDPASPLAA